LLFSLLVCCVIWSEQNNIQSTIDQGSSSSDCEEDDDEPPNPDEEGAPQLLPEGGRLSDFCDDGPPHFSSHDGPLPFPVDADECIGGEVDAAAAAETLAKEMHSTAVPEAPRIYVPPESFYVKW
jgi:hypothetical protein